ncbi:MAG TPA: 2-oxo acid dehydrogenase subunit E2 [Candidatus Bathyarchaeia archaeon]|nr:2-oxo acid dehydrogenase subunit E2 [Candidatus Bathyarchaeia archaeon]
MKKKSNEVFQVFPFPKDRKLTSDLYTISLKQHNIFGITEFDVSLPLEKIREMKEKNLDISFLAFIINCLTKAVEENKLVQGMKKGKKKIVVFDDVDVCAIIASDETWQKVPLAHILRKANEKTLLHINSEIQEVKLNRQQLYKEMEKTIDSLLKVPGWLRRKVIEMKYRNDPLFRKKNAGTVCLTSIGAYFAGRSGWGIPLSSNPLYVILGGIEEKPVSRNKEIVSREMMNVTIVFDHDVTDGAPAVQFVKKFGQLIEEGFGFDTIK